MRSSRINGEGELKRLTQVHLEKWSLKQSCLWPLKPGYVGRRLTCRCALSLLKQLREQGLPLRNLHTVVQAIVLSRLLYALPAWGPLLNVELLHKIDGFFKRSFRYGFTSNLLTTEPILNSAVDLFCKIQLTNHCIHPLLPQTRHLTTCLVPTDMHFSCLHACIIYIRNHLSLVVCLSF